MIDMFRWFKKKEEEELVKEYRFQGKLFTRNIGVINMVAGMYESADDLANRVIHLIENREVFYLTNTDGDIVIVRSKDVEHVKIIGEPLEEINPIR